MTLSQLPVEVHPVADDFAISLPVAVLKQPGWNCKVCATGRPEFPMVN